MRFLLFAALPLLLSAAPDDTALDGRVQRLLKATPLIDGHNDWPEALAGNAKDARWTLSLDALAAPYHTDLARLQAGGLGGQFWSVWVPADRPGPEQVERTIEQIALVHDLARRYPERFAMARTAADVRRIHRSGRIASLIGVEGGGQIDGRFAILRSYHQLGAGYLTLTHSKTIAWADSATDAPAHDGLTPFGEAVVGELNRLGMLVDLSHVSEAAMIDALRVTRAPVIFSHSDARALCDHPRNVSDAVLRQVAANGGVVMVNYAPSYVSEARRVWEAARNAERARYDSPPFGGLFIGQPDKAAAALAAWEAANPRPPVTLHMVADHIDHIARVAGHDHVGIGSDFDGVGDLPEGLGGVDTYPALLKALMRRGWSDANLAKLAGGNILRVMERAERVAASMRDVAPATGTLAALEGAVR